MTVESRWMLLYDDEQFNLKAGDIFSCESMHSAWASEKIASIRRESDGYEPGCSFYRNMVKHLSGPHLGWPSRRELMR